MYNVFKKRLINLKREKKGIELEMLAWWILAIFVLIIMVGGYFVLKGKGIDALEFLKNLVRFKR